MSEVDQWNEIQKQLSLLHETIDNCEKIKGIIETCMSGNIADKTYT